MWWKYGRNTSTNSSNCQKIRNHPNCSDAGLRLVERVQHFHTLETEGGQQVQHLCREYTMPSQWKGNPCETMDSKQYQNRSGLEHKSLVSSRTIQCWSSSFFSFKTTSFHGLELWMAFTDTWQNQYRGRGHSFGETNWWSKTKTEAYSNVLLQFLFLFLKGWTDIESQRSHDEFSKAITRLLRHDQSEPRGIDGAIHYNDIMEECRKNKFDGASQWLHEDWISKLVMGGEAKKIFQHCENPNSPNQFLTAGWRINTNPILHNFWGHFTHRL